MQALWTASMPWWVVLVPALLAIVFLVLWLQARGGGGGSAELTKQLRAAQNENRLLKGDAIQARRDQAAEVEKLNKELETLRAVAGGKVPPELEQWKQRALEAEAKLETQLEQHRAEIEKVLAVVGSGGGEGVDRTMIAPGGTRERMERMEQELAEAKRELAAATERFEGELAALTERLNAEKAAALTAQARRHSAEVEALRSRLPGGAAAEVPPAPAADPAATMAPSSVPDSARYPFLLAVGGTAKGARFYLPFDSATLGRSDTNTVVLQETMASRVHAEVRFDGVDFQLSDRNSTNGTLLNGELVSSAPLAFGDVIAIGETQLRFSCEAEEAAARDPASAEEAYRAMLALAPDCREALQGLGRLLEERGGREDEVQAIAARLQQIEAARPPVAAGAAAGG
jgi:hypothetical protein